MSVPSKIRIGLLKFNGKLRLNLRWLTNINMRKNNVGAY